MNHRGIYAALIALVVVVILSASIMHVLSFRQEYQAEFVSGIPGELQFAAANARYVADKAVSYELYSAAIAGCSIVSVDPDLLAGNINTNYLGVMDSGIECVLSNGAREGAANKTDYSFDFSCEHTATGFTYVLPDRVLFDKEVKIVAAGPPCVVTVEDEQSNEFDIS